MVDAGFAEVEGLEDLGVNCMIFSIAHSIKLLANTPEAMVRPSTKID